MDWSLLLSATPAILAVLALAVAVGSLKQRVDHLATMVADLERRSRDLEVDAGASRAMIAAIKESVERIERMLVEQTRR